MFRPRKAQTESFIGPLARSYALADEELTPAGAELSADPRERHRGRAPETVTNKA